MSDDDPGSGDVGHDALLGALLAAGEDNKPGRQKEKQFDSSAPPEPSVFSDHVSNAQVFVVLSTATALVAALVIGIFALN